MTFSGLGMHIGNLSSSPMPDAVHKPRELRRIPERGRRATGGTGAGRPGIWARVERSPRLWWCRPTAGSIWPISKARAIQQICMTPIKPWRRLILRI